MDETQYLRLSHDRSFSATLRKNVTSWITGKVLWRTGVFVCLSVSSLPWSVLNCSMCNGTSVMLYSFSGMLLSFHCVEYVFICAAVVSKSPLFLQVICAVSPTLILSERLIFILVSVSIHVSVCNTVIWRQLCSWVPLAGWVVSRRRRLGGDTFQIWRS